VSGPGREGETAAQITFCVAVARTDRLDRFLADQLALSRTQAARLVADKRVTSGGRTLRASAILERGDIVSVALPAEAPPRTLAPAHAELRIVYEDDHLAVIDKPAGLVVHPGPGHWDDSLVNVLVGRGTPLSSGGGEEGDEEHAGRPGIVHRLDRDTSGLLLIAKTDPAHRRLARALERREVRRVYAALSWGHFPRRTLTIDAPIARHPVDRKRMAVLATGRHARTHVSVVARFQLAELLRLRLETGRTHQIRVHLAHVGHPVVGDREYGGGGARRITPSQRRPAEALEDLAPRQLLHAAELRLSHPITGAALVFQSEWPADLLPALANAAADPALLAQRNPLQYLGFFTSE
jgi:23S rRNA pseudouridine1911/1915/1917 synthase